MSTSYSQFNDKLEDIKQRKTSKIMKIIFCGIISLTLLVLVYFLINSGSIRKTNQFNLQQQVKHPDYITTKTIIVQSQFIKINKIDFPYLKQLIIQSNNLISLQLQQELQLESLTINNSKLINFSYNSTQLKQIHFIDNKNMTTFWYSNLPNLSNITITRSNIVNWSNNKFGNISVININSSNLSKLFTIQAKNIYNFVLQQCIFQLQNFLSKNPIHKILIIRGQSKDRFIAQNTSLLQSVQVHNTSFPAYYFSNTSLNSVIIEQQKSVTSLSLISVFNLNNIDIRIPSITSLKLNNINITNMSYFENISIYSVQIILVPLKTLQIKSSQALYQLLVDYQLIQDKHFNLKHQYLKYLTIKNYKSNFTFNTTLLTNLIQFNMETSILPQIYLKYDTMKKIVLYTVSSYNNNLTLTFDGNYVDMIRLINVYITQFSNYKNLNAYSLSFEGCSVQKIENNNLFVENIDFQYNENLHTIQNNNISAWAVNFDRNTEIQMNQIYPNATQIDLFLAKSFETKRLNDLFPKAESLTIYGFNISQFSNVNMSSLKGVDIFGSQIKSFKNNNLPKLKFLSIASDLEIFRYNNLPSMGTLQLEQDNPNLNIQQLIQQLKQLKQHSTNLQLLRLPSNTSKQNIQIIQQIFPDCSIVVI